jgi:hypothetical protein
MSRGVGNITLQQGQAKRIGIAVTRSGVPRSLVGFTFGCQIRSSVTSKVVLGSPVVTANSLAGGTLFVDFSAELSASLAAGVSDETTAAVYFWELDMTAPPGEEPIRVQGKAFVEPGGLV